MSAESENYVSDRVVPPGIMIDFLLEEAQWALIESPIKREEILEGLHRARRIQVEAMKEAKKRGIDLFTQEVKVPAVENIIKSLFAKYVCRKPES